MKYFPISSPSGIDKPVTHSGKGLRCYLVSSQVIKNVAKDTV